MTKEEIIRMAREADGTEMQPYDYGARPDRFIMTHANLERFAELVAAAEREACAEELEAFRKANEEFAKRQEWWNDRMVALEAEVLAEREACAKIVEQYCGAWDDAGYALSQAVRARGEK